MVNIIWIKYNFLELNVHTLSYLFVLTEMSRYHKFYMVSVLWDILVLRLFRKIFLDCSHSTLFIMKESLTFSREDKLVERAKTLKVNSGTEPDADLGPVISKQVLIIFLRAIQTSIYHISLSPGTSLSDTYVMLKIFPCFTGKG